MTDRERSSEETVASEQAEEAIHSVSGELTAIWHAAREGLSGILKVAALEGRLAVLSLVLMLIVALAAVLFIITGWLFLWATLAAWAVTSGWPWPLVLLGGATLNLLLAAIAWLMLHRLSRNLSFAATRRSIRGPAGDNTNVRTDAA